MPNNVTVILVTMEDREEGHSDSVADFSDLEFQVC